MYVRTTIKLREDIYQAIKRDAGAKGISERINEILLEALRDRRSLFGTMEEVDTKDLRDHEERI